MGKQVTADDVLEAIHDQDDPVVTAAGLAEQLPTSARTVLNRLDALRRSGEIVRKQVGANSVVWWLPGTRKPRPDAPERERRLAPDQSDLEGAVSDAGEHADTPADATPARSDAETGELADVDFPAGQDSEACEGAVRAAHELLLANDGTTKDEIIRTVHPEHPLGYDPESAIAKLDAEGERYRGAWWRRVVKPGLEALDDVEKPPTGGSAWTVTEGER